MKQYGLVSHSVRVNDIENGPVYLGDAYDVLKQELKKRGCTNQQNTCNQRKRSGNYTSRYKGVSREKRSGKWRATIFVNYKQTHIGLFDNEQEAAVAYNNKAKELHGDFARLNEV